MYIQNTNENDSFSQVDQSIFWISLISELFLYPNFIVRIFYCCFLYKMFIVNNAASNWRSQIKNSKDKANVRIFFLLLGIRQKWPISVLAIWLDCDKIVPKEIYVRVLSQGCIFSIFKTTFTGSPKNALNKLE